MDNRSIAQAIKQVVHMPDLALLYGFTQNRAGFICCPFHGEKTPSLKIHRDYWHCFGCGAGGDVIEFVRKMDGIPFTDACKKLDTIYSLGLYGDVNPVIARALRNRAERTDAAHKESMRTVDGLEAAYWSAFDSWRVLDQILNREPPSSVDQVSEEYAMALRELPRASQAVREAEWALFDAMGITPAHEYYLTYQLNGDSADCFAPRGA